MYPIAMRRETAACIIASGLGKQEIDDADTTLVLGKLTSHGYMKEMGGVYYATENVSFTNVGAESDPWTGWV